MEENILKENLKGFLTVDTCALLALEIIILLIKNSEIKNPTQLSITAELYGSQKINIYKNTLVAASIFSINELTVLKLLLQDN